MLWRALLINYQFQKFDGLLLAHLVSAIFWHHLWPKLFNLLSECILLILSQPNKLVMRLNRLPIFVGQLLNLVHILSNRGLLLFLRGHSGLSRISRGEHVLHPLRFHAKDFIDELWESVHIHLLMHLNDLRLLLFLSHILSALLCRIFGDLSRFQLRHWLNDLELLPNQEYFRLVAESFES